MAAGEIDSRYSYGRIWKIAYPILISLVMEQMIGMTDTAFLGRVGEIEIGASALAGVYYMVIFMLGLGFSIGVQIIIGRRNGLNQYRLLKRQICIMSLQLAFGDSSVCDESICSQVLHC